VWLRKDGGVSVKKLAIFYCKSLVSSILAKTFAYISQVTLTYKAILTLSMDCFKVGLQL